MFLRLAYLQVSVSPIIQILIVVLQNDFLLPIPKEACYLFKYMSTILLYYYYLPLINHLCSSGLHCDPSSTDPHQNPNHTSLPELQSAYREIE